MCEEIIYSILNDTTESRLWKKYNFDIHEQNNIQTDLKNKAIIMVLQINSQFIKKSKSNKQIKDIYAQNV